jgi:hypothetical protein
LGNSATAGYFTATTTTASTFPFASTTGISSTYASSTSGFFGNLSIASLSGFLKATAGVVSTALVDLASNVTGVLPVSNGGTGWANITSNTVLLGNGTGALSTTTRGNLTETGSSILTITGGSNALLGSGTTIQVAAAGSGTSGFLSSTDWNVFNNKISSTSLDTSAELAALLTDETGSGNAVFSASPTFTGTAIFANLSATAATSTDLFAGRLNASSAGFGATATSTFSSAGVLSLVSNGLAVGTNQLVVSGGNVGIGTTTPYAKLSVTNTTAQLALAYDGSNTTDFTVSSGGDITINPQGNDAIFGSDNLFVCNGACPTTPGGSGKLFVDEAIGIGTTTNSSKFTIETGNESDAATAFLRIASTTNQSVSIVDANGSVGIGTSSPSQQLSVAQKLFVGAGNPSTAGTATSTFQGDVLITGKLDVSTIDPVYTIDGVKYATYGVSSVGIKEEMATTVTLQKTKSGKYEYEIDFSKLSEGSDLWLFYQVTAFGSAWEKLVINATPGFDGQVSYIKDAATNTLRIVGSREGEVSLRLIADRFDAAQWPNLRPDQGEGFKGFEIKAKPRDI